jgi:alkylated DNA repair dioxygenase AlkB
MEPKPWIEELLEIKKTIEPIAQTRFNSVLINYYRDGQDRVAWHSDDEKELGQNPVIGSVSLGAERKFKLRHKDYLQNGKQAQIMLFHGSLLVMKGPTQHFWKHEIPRTAIPIGKRINLTFRVIDPPE